MPHASQAAVRGEERGAEAVSRRGGGGGVAASVSKQSGHLVELSRKPTAEQ